MKLFLSSNRIPDPVAFSHFVGKELKDIKLGLILNAKDYKTAEEREVKRVDINGYFSSLGIQVTDIDLRTYYENDGALEALSGFDVLWFNGGNTYTLRQAVENSKCENIVKELLTSNVVYGGDSAGAILAGPTLKYFDKADDPGVTEEPIYDGLNLVNFVVLPHWGSEKYDSSLKYAKTSLEKDGYKTVEITDEEYLLIDNGKILN